MNENWNEDALWFELWHCRSFEELRLKCAIYGVDCKQWLVNEGKLWRPRYEEDND